MKRVISAALSVIMLLCMMASCANNSQETTSSGQSVESTDLESGDKLVIDDTKLDGYEYTVLVSGNIDYNKDYGSDFYFEEEGADNIDSARQKWIYETESKFDIVILTEEKLKFSNCNGSGDGFKAVQKAVTSEDSSYDSCMIGVYDVCSLARNGYLYNLGSDSESNYINLTNSWWDQIANDDLTIQGKIYYTTGDISIIDNVFTHCVLFNKGLITQLSLPNPYEYVDNNTWTLDNFFNIVRKGADTAGVGVSDDTHRYGLLTWNDSMLQIMAAADERIASVNESGELELSMYNDRTQLLYTSWSQVAMDTAFSFNYQVDSKTGWDEIRKEIFDSDRAVLYTTLFSTIVHHRDSETNFGILPYPKLDENQENYGHLISSFHTEFFCIPSYISSESVSTSVSEYMAYLGQTTTKPAYYDDTLQGKYFRDDESFEMLDIIFASRVYDVGTYYKVGNISTRLGGLYSNRNLTFQQIYNESGSIAEAAIKAINEQYAAAED